jgi:hypothetical protein
MIADAPGSRFERVIVMYDLGGLAHAVLALPRFRRTAHDMVKDHHFRRTGSFLQQSLDLGIVDLSHFVLVVKVGHLAVLAREHEPVLVQGQVAEDRPCVADGDGVGRVSPGGLRCARRGGVGIGHRSFRTSGHIIQRGLYLGETLHRVVVHFLAPLWKRFHVLCECFAIPLGWAFRPSRKLHVAQTWVLRSSTGLLLFLRNAPAPEPTPSCVRRDVCEHQGHRYSE